MILVCGGLFCTVGNVDAKCISPLVVDGYMSKNSCVNVMIYLHLSSTCGWAFFSLSAELFLPTLEQNACTSLQSPKVIAVCCITFFFTLVLNIGFLCALCFDISSF